MTSSIAIKFNPINQKIKKFFSYLKRQNFNFKKSSNNYNYSKEELNSFEEWCKKQ